MEDGDGDPPQDDRHGEEDRGLSDCEGSVFVAISSCLVLERQGKEGDGDDQEDVARTTFCLKSSCPFFRMSIALRIALFIVTIVARYGQN